MQRPSASKYTQTLTAMEELTLRYWEASLAWRDRGNYAAQWTTESFIDELRMLCTSYGLVGAYADHLLDDVINDIDFQPLDMPGEVVSLGMFRHSKTFHCAA